MYCRKCGAVLPEGAKYCRKCGTVISGGGNDQHTPVMQKPERNEIPPQKEKKKINKLAVILPAAGVVIAAAIICFFVFGKPAIGYENAMKAFESGDHVAAISAFRQMGDYKDAREKLTEAQLARAEELAEAGRSGEALQIYNEMLAENIDKGAEEDIICKKAELLIGTGDYSAAFTELSDRDSKKAADLADEACLKQLEELVNEGIDTYGIDFWIQTSLERPGTNGQAADIIAGGLENRITNGDLDTAYSALTGILSGYSGRFSEQIKHLAGAYINIGDAAKGKELAQRTGNTDPEVREMLLECEYIEVMPLTETAPTDPETLTRLFELAKADYKDSRSVMDSICTEKWLFSQLVFTYYGTSIYSEREVDVQGYMLPEYNYSVRFDMQNTCPVPMKGNILSVAHLLNHGDDIGELVNKNISIEISPNELKSYDVKNYIVTDSTIDNVIFDRASKGKRLAVDYR